jgi:hypothetical protein
MFIMPNIIMPGLYHGVSFQHGDIFIDSILVGGNHSPDNFMQVLGVYQHFGNQF